MTQLLVNLLMTTGPSWSHGAHLDAQRLKCRLRLVVYCFQVCATVWLLSTSTQFFKTPFFKSPKHKHPKGVRNLRLLHTKFSLRSSSNLPPSPPSKLFTFRRVISEWRQAEMGINVSLVSGGGRKGRGQMKEHQGGGEDVMRGKQSGQNWNKEEGAKQWELWKMKLRKQKTISPTRKMNKNEND